MSAASPPTSKSELRRQLRQRRRLVPEAVRRLAGRQVERLALRHRLIGRGRRVGFYIPANGELNILPLLNRALWLHARCYLPIVPPRGRRKLWFARMGDEDHWSVNRFGIPEYGRQLKKLRIGLLDRVFVPLLGFDPRGYRMGMGGGYYDASLAHLRTRRAWRRPKLIGVGFEAQKVDVLPTDPWDIPLDGAITERGYYRFRRQ